MKLKKSIRLSQSVLHANSEIAEQNRAALDAAGIVALNLMASPTPAKHRWPTFACCSDRETS